MAKLRTPWTQGCPQELNTVCISPASSGFIQHGDPQAAVEGQREGSQRLVKSLPPWLSKPGLGPGDKGHEDSAQVEPARLRGHLDADG